MKNIKEILSLPEGRTLEFKRDLSSLKPILKTITAFANTAGGILLIIIFILTIFKYFIN